MPQGQANNRYVVRYSSEGKFWFVTEDGIALNYESKVESAARKYCSRLNKMANVR